MKKFAICLLTAIFVISALFAYVPHEVLADAGDTGSGTWVLPGSTASFTTINVDKVAKSAPTWLQQLSEGVVITTPVKICYPFAGGKHYWVPQIMQLNAGKWSKVDTQTASLYGVEAEEYACATPKTAGTFALFGFYNGPVEVETSLPACDGVEISAYFFNTTHDGAQVMIILIDSVPTDLVGKSLSYTIIDSAPASVTLSPISGAFTYYDSGASYSYRAEITMSVKRNVHPCRAVHFSIFCGLSFIFITV